MHARFGSEHVGKNSNFLISTTTPYVVITSKDCENCGNKGEGIFDADDSDDFEEISDPDDPINMTINPLSF